MKNEKHGPFELHTQEFQDGFIYEWRFGDGKIQSEHRYPTKSEAEDAAHSYLLVLLLRVTTELAERINRVWHGGEGYP